MIVGVVEHDATKLDATHDRARDIRCRRGRPLLLRTHSH